MVWELGDLAEGPEDLLGHPVDSPGQCGVPPVCQLVTGGDGVGQDIHDHAGCLGILDGVEECYSVVLESGNDSSWEMYCWEPMGRPKIVRLSVTSLSVYCLMAVLRVLAMVSAIMEANLAYGVEYPGCIF
eukprot:14018069-Ditylum_brightwellii.AAC.1